MTTQLMFTPSTSKEEILSTYKYDVEAFSDSTEFNWSVDGINDLISSGWDLYSASVGTEIVGAVFLKEDGQQLLTKSTPIKIIHQGNGYSHAIKNFIEDMAVKQKKSQVVNYCAKDNFRGISLNESHGYTNTGKVVEDGCITIWSKKLD